MSAGDRDEGRGSGARAGARGGAGAGVGAAKASAAIGIVAAMVLAVVANVYTARHYTRWDVTKGGLFTLSEPTLQTLHSLEEPVQIYVMLPAGDPLTTSVEHVLSAYEAETSRLEVKTTDPDRHPAEFLAIQQKYGVEVGKTEDGRILTDAAIIVARRDKPYFLTANDLVAVEDEEDVRVRPRLEEAITTAIRAVLGGKKPRVCFASGHGEKALDAGGEAGVVALKDRLVKNNYEVSVLPPARAGEKEELPGCALLVIAGPTEPVPAEDVARYVGFVKAGGSALVAVSPALAPEGKSYVDLRLGDLFAALGLRMESDMIFELDPKRRDPNAMGEVFMPEVKPHAITDGLIKAADLGIGVTMQVASSLTKLPGAASATPLLVTSDRSFGMVDFFTWAQNPTPPSAKEEDHKGPLTVAWAVELPKPAGGAAERGARAVVIGSSDPLASPNWQNEELRGTSAFIESAISWLVSQPQLVSVGKKPAVAAGLRVSAEDVKRLGLYTVLCMPLATALFGVAVHLRRRSGERRGKKGEGEKGERLEKGETAAGRREGAGAKAGGKGAGKGRKKGEAGG